MKIGFRNKILFFVIVLSLVVGFMKDVIVKFSIQQAVKAATGLNVKIGSLQVGFLMRRSVAIKNLEVQNPKAFDDRVMADVPEIYVDYDLGSVFSEKMFLHELRLNLKEFSIVKNQKGELNINAIKIPKSESKKDIQIGDFHLKVAKIVFHDYSQNPAVVKEYNVNLDERFQNIDGVNALVRIVLFKAVTSSAAKNSINFDSEELKSSIEGALAEGEKVIGGAVGDALRGAGEKLKSIFGK